MELPQDTTPSSALALSQQAPGLLQSQPPSSAIFPLSLFSTAETSDAWSYYENLLVACLRTGDDKSAHLCLERLNDRFGATNPRVMGLRGLFQEAVAEDEAALDKILDEYDKILEETPMNMPIQKRRVALLRSMSRSNDAIGALVDLLEATPTDAEAWCELAELYQSQGMGSQARFSLEEALLIAPNAWNLHARLGEVDFMSALSNPDATEESQKLLVEAVRRFCRSVELCEDYVRGYYGLVLATDRLLQRSTSSKGGHKASGESAMSPEIIEELNNMARTKLAKIVKSRASVGQSKGEVQGELIAAKELLDRTET